MSSPAPLEPQRMARAYGIDLDPERAELLKPLLNSLIARLARLTSALPDDAAPPPAAPHAGAR